MKAALLFLSLFLFGCSGGDSPNKPEEIEDPIEEETDYLAHDFYEYTLESDNGQFSFQGVGARSSKIFYFKPIYIGHDSQIAELTVNESDIAVRTFSVSDRQENKFITIDIETMIGEDQNNITYSLSLEPVTGYQYHDGAYSGVDKYGCSGDDCVTEPTNCNYTVAASEDETAVKMEDCDIAGDYTGASWVKNSILSVVATNKGQAVVIRREL